MTDDENVPSARARERAVAPARRKAKTAYRIASFEALAAGWTVERIEPTQGAQVESGTVFGAQALENAEPAPVPSGAGAAAAGALADSPACESPGT